MADATRDNTIQASRMVLGWAKNVAGRQGEPTLNWLLDGELIAGYVSWGGAVRYVLRRCSALLKLRPRVLMAGAAQEQKAKLAVA